MRILMTADPLGGVWTYAVELCAALADAEVEVVLVAVGGRPRRNQRAQLERLPGLRLVVDERKMEWMEDPWSDLERGGRRLLDLASETSPHVVHLNEYALAALPWEVPVVVVGHSCVLSWWRAVRGEGAPAEWDVYRQRVRAGLKAADAVVTPTRAMADALARHYGRSRPVRVVPNGRSATRFQPCSPEPFVLTMGRIWDEAKNVRALVQAAPRIPWTVVAAGDDRHPATGRREPLAHVVALGQIGPDQAASWMGRASIYALPARYEPFGYTPLEAALSGCALVLGDIPSLREVWGEAARFVPPDDADALVAAIRELIEEPSLLREAARRARRRALAYDAGRMGCRYLELYARLVARRSMAGVA